MNPNPIQIGPERNRILVVDDEPCILTAVRRLIGRQDEIEVLTSERPMDALALLQKQEMAVVISDFMMPDMSGMELLGMVRQKWPHTVCIMLTASGDVQVAADAINGQLIHYFICKPWKGKEFYHLVTKALQQFTANKQAPVPSGIDQRAYVRQQAEKAVFSLARAVDARDHYTHCHSRNVARFAMTMGQAMGLEEQAIEELRMGGFLHDVGKIGIPDSILLKSDRLTDREYRAIKSHPMIGVAILQPLDFPHSVVTMVGQHHENHDGSGYPLGLGGQAISLPARIIHAVDAYEAMVSNRVYRQARSVDFALAEFERFRGIQFDPDVADVVSDLICKGELQVL